MKTSEFAVDFSKTEEKDNVIGNSYATFQIRKSVGSSLMFFKIGDLKNFANFTGKALCWSIFLIKF